MAPLLHSKHLKIVDDELIALLESNETERLEWLFLEPHADFPGHWMVEAFDKGFYFDLHEHIGPYRVVAPAALDKFLTACTESGYKVAFFEDPATILDHYARLNDPPPFEINSDLPDTVNGMLPYQVQGFNFLKDLPGAVAMWSTGTGKTVLASSLVKYHLEHEPFDVCLFVVKSHNKVNTQRALKTLTGLESIVVAGDKQAREATYGGLVDRDVPAICITNYEKFRVDGDALLPLFEDRDVLVVWDEMPTRLKNRTTQVYRSVCRCLYRTAPPQVAADRTRPSRLRQIMLSATPIEQDPEDFFNCVRLLDPTVYGTVKEFQNEFVRTWNYFDSNKPEAWHKLDKMGLKAAHIVHQVDKSDPDIAAQFPKVMPVPYYIDWDEKDRKIYDRFTKELMKELDDEINVISAIGVMQMLCDAPSMVSDSAARRESYESAVEAWLDSGGFYPDVQGSTAALRLIETLGTKLTNERHTKLEALRQILCEDHPDEKVVVFSALNNSLMPILEAKLKEWGVTYVRYNGTLSQRQQAQDAFTFDPSVRVFLSSDAGSDSINLEAASVVVNYDLPWKWSTLTQRENRIHRITSKFATVTFYTLMMVDSIEDRKWKIVQLKRGYHEGVFKGAIADQSASARMTKSDLLYILGG